MPFQKNHKINNGRRYKWKTNDPRREQLRMRMGKAVGQLHPRWKGGKPKCHACGKVLTNYNNKTCRRHYVYSEERRIRSSLMAKKHGFGKWMLGKKASEATIAKLKSRKPSFETKQKIRNALIGRPNPKTKGENNANWQGGITKKQGHYFKLRMKRLKDNGGFHTTEQWEELKKKFQFTCPCCLKKEPEIKLEKDHIIPVSKGGGDSIENIQPLCRRCNLKKWRKEIRYEHCVVPS